MISRLARIVAAASAFVLISSSCASESTGNGSTVRVAIVSNSQMQDAIALSPQFEAENPDITIEFVSLSENEARARITESVSTEGGEFDVVMISNYETPQWAENGWLTNLSDYAENTPGYDQDDFVPTVKESLSYAGALYSVPFYGESSFLMYRTDLFEQAGLTMPAQPTWQDVAGYAATLNRPGSVSGICLRGKTGWGEMLAPLDTVINAFGGRWFDEDWNAQLTSPEVERAVQFYVSTVRDHGQPGASTSGYSECATRMARGESAMWYDATAAVSTLEDPSSAVAGKIGYVPAPTDVKSDNGWLYSWALGIPTTTTVPDAAWKFVSWMTDKDYIRTVGAELGWDRVPPGSRLSTYAIPEYEQAAAAYGPLTLESMERADPANPTVQPVPYTGIQFITIPEFQDLGTSVSQLMSAAVAGRIGVPEALEQAQQLAEVVGRTYREAR